jgi:two-component system, OmpR family, KDP operon response regulator KdpE
MSSEQPRVLAVDDEAHILDLLRVVFHRQGIDLLEAHTAAQALARLRAEAPDLIVLDLGLPDRDGFEVLSEIRRESAVPVIILTVRDDEAEKVRGLELGADDYVTKPFSPAELAARVKAVLRRVDTVRLRSLGRVVVDEYLQVDFDERLAIVAGRPVHLRPTEHRLLQLLIEHAGHTLSFTRILEDVWGSGYQNEAHYVHLYVTYLRQKIEPVPSRPHYILTRRGLGYQFRAEAGATSEVGPPSA